MSNPSKIRADIIGKLLAAVEPDPKFIPFTSKIVNTPSKMLGVKIPVLRKIAKEVVLKYGIDCWQVLSCESFEETTLAGLIMAATKDMTAAYNLLQDFCPKVDNWATCDVVCSTFKAFCKDKQNEYLPKFIALAKSDDEFTARVGIVMLMDYYIKPEVIDKVLDCVASLANHAYYVDMAAAWLISVAVIKCPQPTIRFIKSKKLTKFVQNKAVSKCQDSYRITAEVKAELKEYRII